MSRPTDRPSGRVEPADADHLADAHESRNKGADSVAGSSASSSSTGRVGRIELFGLVQRDPEDAVFAKLEDDVFELSGVIKHGDPSN